MLHAINALVRYRSIGPQLGTPIGGATGRLDDLYGLLLCTAGYLLPALLTRRAT